MANTYKAQLWVMQPSKYPTVQFTSSAKTRKGVLRALGKAIARQVGDDAIHVNHMMVRDGQAKGYSLNSWHSFGHITYSEENYVFEVCHDELFNLRYA